MYHIAIPNRLTERTRTMITQPRQFVSLTIIVLLGLASEVKAESAPCELPPPNVPANVFNDASLTPDLSVVALLKRFAHIADGDVHQKGWVAARLFPLSNRVVVAGVVRVGTRCKAASSQDISDGDLWFYLRLTEESRRHLAKFFNGKLAKVPMEVHVEIIDLCRKCSNPPEFTGWDSTDPSQLIRFGRPNKALGPMSPGGLNSSDWQCLLRSVEWNARVTGPLVADIAATMPQAGLEIPCCRYRVAADR